MTPPRDATVYLVGGAPALGFAVAREFVRAGTQRIGLIGSDPGAGARSAERIRASALGVWSLAADAAPGDAAGLSRALTELTAALGPPDIAVLLPGDEFATSGTLATILLLAMRDAGGGTIVAVAAGAAAAALAVVRTLAPTARPCGIEVHAVGAALHTPAADQEIAEAVLAATGGEPPHHPVPNDRERTAP
ncbi:short chain dehydrogenase [Nocardia farcinica]|uniref:hypothetical protein n=1 Tax=Nocardia farcinica TaxID=37329 RepID=UPI000A371506|nr:hypothetical protein [Nocardia farcinica]SUE28896.1 short chain dehydrogenase [Nocardia farcinica]